MACLITLKKAAGIALVDLLPDLKYILNNGGLVDTARLTGSYDSARAVGTITDLGVTASVDTATQFTTNKLKLAGYTKFWGEVSLDLKLASPNLTVTMNIFSNTNDYRIRGAAKIAPAGIIRDLSTVVSIAISKDGIHIFALKGALADAANHCCVGFFFSRAVKGGAYSDSWPLDCCLNYIFSSSCANDVGPGASSPTTPFSNQLITAASRCWWRTLSPTQTEEAGGQYRTYDDLVAVRATKNMLYGHGGLPETPFGCSNSAGIQAGSISGWASDACVFPAVGTIKRPDGTVPETLWQVNNSLLNSVVHSMTEMKDYSGELAFTCVSVPKAKVTDAGGNLAILDIDNLQTMLIPILMNADCYMGLTLNNEALPREFIVSAIKSTSVEVYADGGSVMEFEVTVTDAQGLPVVGATDDLRMISPTVKSLTEIGSGKYKATLTSRVSGSIDVVFRYKNYYTTLVVNFKPIWVATQTFGGANFQGSGFRYPVADAVSANIYEITLRNPDGTFKTGEAAAFTSVANNALTGYKCVEKTPGVYTIEVRGAITYADNKDTAFTINVSTSDGKFKFSIPLVAYFRSSFSLVTLTGTVQTTGSKVIANGEYHIVGFNGTNGGNAALNAWWGPLDNYRNVSASPDLRLEWIGESPTQPGLFLAKVSSVTPGVKTLRIDMASKSLVVSPTLTFA